MTASCKSTEVHVTQASRTGNGIPRDLFSVQTGLDLFGRRLRITTSFDYKGGYSTQDGANNFQCNSPRCPASRRRIPMRRSPNRRRAIAKTYGTTYPTECPTKSGAGYFMNGQFWKWREASAILQLPDRVTHLSRAERLEPRLRREKPEAVVELLEIDPRPTMASADVEVQNEFQTGAAPTYFTVRLNLKY